MAIDSFAQRILYDVKVRLGRYDNTVSPRNSNDDAAILSMISGAQSYIDAYKLDTATETRIAGAIIELSVNRCLSTILSHTNKNNKHTREVLPIALKGVIPDNMIRELVAQADTSQTSTVQPTTIKIRAFGTTQSIADIYYEDQS